MEKTDNDQVILESINEKVISLQTKIGSIESKIDEFPKENERYFLSNIFFSMGIVIVTIAITLLIQLLALPEYLLWLTFGFYIIMGLSFIYISRLPLEKKK